MDDTSDEEPPVPPQQAAPLKDGGGRPSIKEYSTVLLTDSWLLESGYKFSPGGRVRIKATTTQGLRGPYTVTATHAGPTYTLEKSDGSSVDGGKHFAEDELDHA
ncbi:hypothetical protein NX059_002957 [Plenodomus lindquistii]|nr:hypothetical protein NX059_002957 [Plenodomus lindquistii]